MDRNAAWTGVLRDMHQSLSARRAWIEIRPKSCTATMAWGRSPQGEHKMFLFLTVQGGFVHADIRFNF